jgi:hypothetical protein
MARSHADDLQRGRLAALGAEAANADRLLARPIGIEPERTEQARPCLRRSIERHEELPHLHALHCRMAGRYRNRMTDGVERDQVAS